MSPVESMQYERLLRLVERSLRVRHERALLRVARTIDESWQLIDEETDRWAISAEPLEAYLARITQGLQRQWPDGPAKPVLVFDEAEQLHEAITSDAYLVLRETGFTALLTREMTRLVETAWSRPLESVLGTSLFAQSIEIPLQEVIVRVSGLNPRREQARFTAAAARVKSDSRKATAQFLAVKLREQVANTAYQSFDSTAGARLAERLGRVQALRDRLEATVSAAAMA